MKTKKHLGNIVRIAAIVLAIVTVNGCGKKAKTIENETTKKEYETVTSTAVDGIVTVYEVRETGLEPVSTIEENKMQDTQIEKIAEQTENQESTDDESPIVMDIQPESSKQPTVSNENTEIPTAPPTKPESSIEQSTNAPYVEPETEAPTQEVSLNNMPYPFYTVCSYDGKNGYFYPRDSYDYEKDSAADHEAVRRFGSSNGMYTYTFDDTGLVNFQAYWQNPNAPTRNPNAH